MFDVSMFSDKPADSIESMLFAPRGAKRRIRAYSPEYYEWLGATAVEDIDDDLFAPMPDMEAKALVKAVFTPFTGDEMHMHIPLRNRPMVRAGHVCNGGCIKGTVHYWRSGETGKCGRCNGKGFIDADDIARNNRYKWKTEQGHKMSTTYETYKH